MSKLTVEIVALTAIFFLEGWFPLFQGRSNRIRHGLTNISFGIINGLFVSLVFSHITVFTINWTKENSFGLLNFAHQPVFLKSIFAFVLFDLWMYLWHVANHNLPFFWRFHRIHHTDLEMDVTTALRFHTGEIFLSSLVRLIIIPLIGMDLTHLFIYELCLQPVILFHHSNIALPEKWDRMMRAIFVTPNMHRVHHSQVNTETNSNYSSIFSPWDRIGRTFRKREEPKTIVFGLEQFKDKDWQDFLGMLKTPFVDVE